MKGLLFPGVLFLIGALSPLLVQGDLGTIANEGTCLQPAGVFDTTLNLDWITSIPRFYISYGSLQFWVQNAQVCLGSPPLTLAVLASMELKTHWDLNSTTTCFGRSYSQECTINTTGFSSPLAECRVTRADPGTNTAILADFKKRVVLTDNRTYALFMRCTGGLLSYYVASPSPAPISQANLQAVLARVMALGFDPTLFTRIQNRDIDYLPNAQYKY